MKLKLVAVVFISAVALSSGLKAMECTCKDASGNDVLSTSQVP